MGSRDWLVAGCEQHDLGGRWLWETGPGWSLVVGSSECVVAGCAKQGLTGDWLWAAGLGIVIGCGKQGR